MGTDQLDFLGQKYNLLPYHLPYLREFLNVYDVRGKDILEVGGAMPAEIVIDCLGCNSWTATESPDYDAELGPTNQQLQTPLRGSNNYHTLLQNIEEFDAAHHGRFDCIFSIACFEHIAKFPQALDAMYRCLKPGGMLFSMFSPLWSSHEGHHLYHLNIPERFDSVATGGKILMPWEHLLKSRTSLYRDLEKRFDRAFAGEVIYNAFNSPHINRYFTEDFAYFVSNSQFSVVRMNPSFIVAMPEGYQYALELACPSYKSFANQGIYLVLLKP